MFAKLFGRINGEQKMMTLENPASDPLSEPGVASSEVVALRTAVAERTTQLCTRDYTGPLRAVVLTGSLARDEATWARKAGEWRLLGDAEFFLVFEPRARLPSRPILGVLEREIESVLERERIVAHLQLAPVYARYFTELRPHIFAYELRTRGLVMWGDASILALIPGFTAADISLEDAWRLLANRMIEHLEAVAATGTNMTTIPEGLRYRTAKLYLDMATSLLVFTGSYAPTYKERQSRLGILANTAGTNEGWPFPLGPFAQQVNVATDMKLNGEWGESVAAEWDFWRQSVQYARRLWQWELGRMTNGLPASEDSELLQSWIRRQPFVNRLRGWMFVWRAAGWLRSWRWWLRWARLLKGGSPRFWVYSAAFRLFCQLPAVLEAGGDKDASAQVVDEVMNCLPVVRSPWAKGRKLGWAELVEEVIWNYHRFLAPTRA